MSFIWPWMLGGLVVVPLFVVAYGRLQARRRAMLARYSSLGFVQSGPSAARDKRRHLPAAFFLLGLTLLVMALARPQSTFSLPRQEGTVMLVFDVSGSMAADDLKPTRLEAAKVAARAFVERQPASVQIGVVSFSEGGFATQAPTDDQAAIIAAIDRLSVQKGTGIGQGIQVALFTIAGGVGEGEGESAAPVDPAATPTPLPLPEGSYPSASIVLLTDGENNVRPDPLEVAQQAAERDVRIYPVGVGSPAGTMLKLNGFSVRTRLDEALLSQIADLTDGTYYSAGTEQELQAIYEKLDLAWVVKDEETEITSWMAGLSLLILMVGGAMSLAWFGRLP